MASQCYIFDLEKKIIDAQDVAAKVLETIRTECEMNDGAVYRENRDCWGTLLTNLKVCQSHLGDVARRMEHLLNEKEEGRDGKVRAPAPA
jgi:hypothetical protein